MNIDINCPKCGRLWKVDDSDLSVTCPDCGAALFDLDAAPRRSPRRADPAKYAAVMTQSTQPKVQDVRVVKIDLSFWNILCLSFAFGIAFGLVMLAGRLLFG